MMLKKLHSCEKIQKILLLGFNDCVKSTLKVNEILGMKYIQVPRIDWPVELAKAVDEETY